MAYEYSLDIDDTWYKKQENMHKKQQYRRRHRRRDLDVMSVL